MKKTQGIRNKFLVLGLALFVAMAGLLTFFPNTTFASCNPLYPQECNAQDQPTVGVIGPTGTLVNPTSISVEGDGTTSYFCSDNGGGAGYGERGTIVNWNIKNSSNQVMSSSSWTTPESWSDPIAGSPAYWNGQVIGRQTFLSGGFSSTNIDVSVWPAGVYTLNFEAVNETSCINHVTATKSSTFTITRPVVTPPPPPPVCAIDSFTADSTSLANNNTGTTLRFSLSGGSFPWSISLLTTGPLPSPYSGTGTGGTASTGNLPGNTTYRLTCGSATSDLTVSVAAPVEPITVDISASPTTMTLPVNSTRLTWTTTGNPDSCTASNYWSGAKSVAGSFEDRTGMTAGTYIFDIKCSKAGTPDVTSSVSVVVKPTPPVGAISVDISASPSTMTLPVNSTRLTWTTTGNPDSCTASNYWGGDKSVAGSFEDRTGMTAGTYIFDIKCSKAGTPDVTSSVSVTVSPTQVCSGTITTSPNIIQSCTGVGSTTVVPNSNCAYDVRVNGVSGPIFTQGGPGPLNPASLGQTPEWVTNGTVFYLQKRDDATSGGTIAKSIPINMSCNTQTPVVTLNANPTTGASPLSTTLTWSASNNPSSCVAGGGWSGTKSASGSQTISGLMTQTTFSLTCSNTHGDGTGVVVVTPNTPPPPPVPTAISVNLSASPSTMTLPVNSTRLTWTTTGNPDSCTASNYWSGDKSVAGSFEDRTGMTAGTYIFDIKCSKAGTPDATSRATVVVGSVGSISVNISASPSSMTLPANTTKLTWTTSGNPDSCTASNYWSGAKSASGGSEDRTGMPPGIYLFDITCTKAGVGSVVSRATVTVNALPPPAGAISVMITADPVSMTLPTNSTKLTWTTTGNPTSCTSANDWPTRPKNPLGGSEVRSNLSVHEYAFDITCSKAGTPDAFSRVKVTVGVPPPPPTTGSDITVTLTATPAGPLINPGATNLSWTTTGNPTRCDASNYWSGDNIHNGDAVTQRSGMPAGTYLFDITCFKAGAPNAFSRATVIVNSENTSGALLGRLFRDDNCDGQYNAGEPILIDKSVSTYPASCKAGGVTYDNSQNISVNFVGPSPSETSVNHVVNACDIEGGYYAYVIKVGDYSVSAVIPPGWKSTTPNPVTGEYSRVVDNGHTHVWFGLKPISANCPAPTIPPTSNNYWLKVYKTVGGLVRSTDGGINCGTQCSKMYPINTTVTLIPEPNSTSWKFIRWTGDCTGQGIGNNNKCIVKINGEKEVTAVFSLKPAIYQEF